MSMIRGSVGPGIGGAVVAIQNSLRFRESASPYLSWTAGIPTDGKKWVYRVLFKKPNISTGGGSPSYRSLFGVQTTTAGVSFCNLTNWPITGTVADQLVYGDSVTSISWNGLFRDPAAFVEIVVAYDSTQAVATDRIRMWKNGVLQTYNVSSGLPALNAVSPNINTNASVHRIASIAAGVFLDGVVAGACFIDGTCPANPPALFSATDATSEEWKSLTSAQIRASVAAAGGVVRNGWGANGWMLMFNGTPGATIYDRSQSDTDTTGNNWTATNVSTTPGTTYDWLIDSPINAASGTRPVGNYCAWNPLSTVTTATLASANLDAGASGIAIGTIGMQTSGTYYWEITSTGGTSTCGMYNTAATTTTTVTTGTTKGFRYNAATGAFDFTSDGTTWTSITTGLTTYPYFPYVSTAAATTASLNCGQKPWVYAPTGVSSLCSANLPTPAVPKGSTHFQTKLDTGANIKATCEAVYTYLLEWIKDRANANNHQLLDTVRGLAGNALQSNTTSPGAAYSAPAGNSVGWVWNLAGAAASNTAGSITSSVAVNATAGIAVGTYTGTGVNATVGHGLGFAPTAADGYMIFVKDTTAASANNWMVAHSSLTSAAYYILLNTTGAEVNDATAWNSTAPTSTVFSIGTNAAVNTAGHTYEFIVFFGVPGFSKFGTYTGNTNNNGPFTYTGFAPVFNLIKGKNNGTVNWNAGDNARSPYNVVALSLYPNTTAADAAGTTYDILSNGFKQRGTDATVNQVIYIYGSWAAAPFNYSNAR